MYNDTTGQLRAALLASRGADNGLPLAERWQDGFTATYWERNSVAAAIADIACFEQIPHRGDVALALVPSGQDKPFSGRLKLYRTHDDKVPLAEILPILEDIGLRVISEVPCCIHASDGHPCVWVHDFEVESRDQAPLTQANASAAIEQTVLAVWQGAAESDGFNRLILNAALSWQDVSIIRAYAKYLRQVGCAYSQPYMERALAANPHIAQSLIALFNARFDPDFTQDRNSELARIESLLVQVENADDDRILRRFLNLITATLRTNAFQVDKPHLAFKLDSHRIDDLPQPHPMAEIWIYSPRVEAIHLRGGKVARGGIRWSDRREDFRTEILGLMKAQMVKNTVIVPVGAKGGFVVKRPPAAGGREALQAEGIECYRLLIRGILDLTDNITPDGIVPPANTVRYDDDDPYLVVAADKGTATFSDIANAISVEHGFWLGDAFASGGSRGYDHKAMGITARGAWEAVKRHFREINVDCQKDGFTVIGVGDMSGDVFGNGLLQSRSALLIGAFNHSHIMIDPTPDPSVSYQERLRQFKAVKSWPDYNPDHLSPGGGIFPRTAKTIPVSLQMKQVFGLSVDSITPTELIKVLLTHPTDLLFFGGIGTYIKAHGESNSEVGDRANDALRVNGRDVKAKIIGEGANLGMTQLGRIEAAASGVRLNTDAIDNSAGVDTSDHEVNIKILLDGLIAHGRLPAEQRDGLLATMTNEIAALVLRDNYLQTQALSCMETHASEELGALGRFMRRLERQGRLDRTIEFLPDEEGLARRSAGNSGLTRPELAVLLGYAKLWLYDEVLASDLPDDPSLGDELTLYFPTMLRGRFMEDIPKHKLRREIITNQIINTAINRLGVAFLTEMGEKTGHGPVEIVRAFIVARDAYRLTPIWREIEALDGKIAAATQAAMLTEINRLLERVIAWILRWVPKPFDMNQTIMRLRNGVEALDTILQQALPDDLTEILAQRTARYVQDGVPLALANRVSSLIVLASVGDILAIAEQYSAPIKLVGGVYFAVGARFGLGRLRSAAQLLCMNGYWEKLAGLAAMEDLHAQQRVIAQRVIGAGDQTTDTTPDILMGHWAEINKADVARCDAILAEIRAMPRIDLAMLAVAGRQLRSLVDGSRI